MSVKYWTWVEGLSHCCSKHKTLKAAIAAAKKCEADGSSRHTILKVETVKR